MCAAVLGEVRPENVTWTRNVSRMSSSVTIAKPVPDDAVGGFSLAADRAAVKFMVVAWDAVAQSTADANNNSRFFITPPMRPLQEVAAAQDKRLSAAALRLDL